MTPREAKIQDHEAMLEIRKKSLRKFWPHRGERHIVFGREITMWTTLRWIIEDGKFHRDMIKQLRELPDLQPLDYMAQWVA